MKVNFNRIIIPSSRDNILNLFTKFIQCKICMNLLNDPYDCLCCNQTFCKSCIINYIKTNNKCPFSEFFDINKQKEKNQYIKSNIHDLLNKIKPSSSNFAKIIQSLKFYCQNNDKGCKAELNIEEISEHEKICKYKVKKIKVELNNRNKNISNTIFRNRKDKDKNIDKEKEINLFDVKFNSFDSNNDLLQINRNNEIKHQDSVVSFSGIKNLSENKDINQFYLNENSLNNIFYNSKLEKSIEEINQKLSYINNFITNNYDFKFLNDIKINSKTNKKIDNDFPDIYKTENNETELNKIIKRNSTTITNNFYDGSYINTVNNFTNDNLNLSHKNNCFNTINNNINPKENKILPFKTKQNNAIFKEYNKKKKKKINKLCKSLKSRKNTARILTNSKKNIKNKVDKKSELNEEKINKEKDNQKDKDKEMENNNKENNIENKLDDKLLLKNQILINDITNATPKLGEKSKSRIEDIKAFDLKLNLNFENNNKNNSVCGKSSECSNINEDIFNGIKNLNCKITDIERLLQSNNSFKNQAYSIQTDDLFGDIQNDDSITKGTISIKSSIKEIQNLKKCKNTNINKEQNDNNIITEGNNDKKENNNSCGDENKNEENEKIKNDNFLKNIEKIIENIEENIKNILKDKFDNFKKYIEEQVMEDIKKSVLDTNFDIMTLCTDKLNEYEKILNEKINNLKF